MNMTPKQQEVFCEAAALGVACGLNHRYEWLRNAVRALAHQDYTTIPKRMDELEDAFLAFERNTAGSEREQQQLNNMTMRAFRERVTGVHT
jgi:hypothetical protein